MSEQGWTEEGGKLCRTFRFKDFSEAFGFMVCVAMVAERQGHHPEWTNSWNVVVVRLSTHDAGGAITDKDRKLAASMDALFEG